MIGTDWQIRKSYKIRKPPQTYRFETVILF